MVHVKPNHHRPCWSLCLLAPLLPRSSLGFSSTRTSRQGLSATDSTADVVATLTIPAFDQEEKSLYPSPLHRIHVTQVLSDEEAAQCLSLAVEHARETGSWEQPDQDRHSTYATCDFPIDDCESMDVFLEEVGFTERIWNQLSTLYGVPCEDMTYLDLFCAHYQAKEGDDKQQSSNIMDRLEPHRDGSLLSFTVLLNPPSQFEGGGTVFDALRDVPPNSVLAPGGVIRPHRAGDATLHCGKAFHGADTVTSGNRTVLVGFVDVSDWWQRPGVLSAACRDWGRMDVARLRSERQQKKTQSTSSSSATEAPSSTVLNGDGWIPNNEKWLPTAQGRSHALGFVPAFSSVRRRADPEFQRFRKLQAEDRLLRTILLDADDVQKGPGDVLGGDVTVL